ncbi:energy-coupling factor ABC transporter substrate-binding protein [Streptomyces sp. PAL114]|uniref:energy-coupling factor ABC transporter substrate-binding protein n=1 Tax=Streptomyces sp. PAL114 TaxID=2970893 RepID=UPI0028FD4694|nr:energy-coupling factor ABC transporter substrate-binding protein [Streptomyces sp. PAL114]MDU0301433.1 energy-coupling factor ABC transporter substrate-binding protein [Streptomyces sp. PAL114]
MSRNARINTLLLLLVAALAVIPLVFGLGDHKEEPFAGADGEAETAITEIDPDYEPWFSPLYEPPSGEIESALFALQAALGAGVLAYYFGLRRGRRQGEARAGAREPTAADAGAGAAGTGAAGTGAGAGTGTGAGAGTGTGAAGTAVGAGTGTGTGAAGDGAGVRTGAGDGRD